MLEGLTSVELHFIHFGEQKQEATKANNATVKPFKKYGIQYKGSENSEVIHVNNCLKEEKYYVLVITRSKIIQYPQNYHYAVTGIQGRRINCLS